MGPLRIAVWATTPIELELLTRLLRDSGPWEVIPLVRGADPNAFRSRVVAYVVGTDGATPRELADMSGRATSTPLIAIASEPPLRIQPTYWLPPRPTASLLAALLYAALGITPPDARLSPPPASAPPLSWRRKTDMIIGGSEVIRRLLHTLDHLSPSLAPVMITGESGTGKELVARALHYCGPRAGGPFIAINCAAIPEQLFESELFGYQRGAFTGATTARTGAFELAHQGTLFLDEIGEMPRLLQPKLLRVLERGEVNRLGSHETKRVRVRIVAATNRDLEAEVSGGRFREDLYYRLRVCLVHVPPLRERPEDVPPIVQHHMAIIAAREGRTAPRMTNAALEKLLSHSWPGNVRELVNTLERAFLLARDAIDAEHIDVPIRDGDAAVLPYRDAKAKFDQEYYSQLMRIAGGNVSLAAKLAQKTRKEIYDALKRSGLDAMAYRAGSDPPED